MFIGIDVNHDVRKVLPSAVALIASLNNSCTKFFSRVHVQRIHQEITDNMQPLFSEALECYAEVRKYQPFVYVGTAYDILQTTNLLIFCRPMEHILIG